jgi:N-methylhydantoinase B
VASPARPGGQGIKVPLVYAKAYARSAPACAVVPEIPNNAVSLAPFEITVPESSIVDVRRPAPVAMRHLIGHMTPDTVYGALGLGFGHVSAETAERAYDPVQPGIDDVLTRTKREAF